MIEDIRTIRVFKSIPIKVYEEIKINIVSFRANKVVVPYDVENSLHFTHSNQEIEWVEGIPYVVEWI